MLIQLFILIKFDNKNNKNIFDKIQLLDIFKTEKIFNERLNYRNKLDFVLGTNSNPKSFAGRQLYHYYGHKDVSVNIDVLLNLI